MAGKIIITQYMSLDGVIEDPVGMEGSGLGDWTGAFTRGPVGDKFKEEELRDARALILGRKTYDGFAAVWPIVEGDYAARMNALPKYLASRSLSSPDWANTTVMGDDLDADVRRIKDITDGNILIFGSATVCHELLRQELVDAISLFVYPVILGKGVKLFPDGLMLQLRTVEQTSLNDGLVLLRYDVEHYGSIQASPD